MDWMSLIVDGLWIAVLSIMAGASRQAWRLILPDAQVPIAFDKAGQPKARTNKAIALLALPVVGAVLWIVLMALGRRFGPNEAMVSLGLRALFAPIFALVHLSQLRRAMKALDDEGQLRG